jgi:hypothetical protein
VTTIDQTSATAAATDAYLAAVAAALAGVPDPERQDLLDDLADHLAELAAEDGPDLTERLGPPERYAAELVASAGITVPEPVTVLDRPPAGVRARQAITTTWHGPTARAVRDFLPELRPGWWVLRAWAALALLSVAVGGDDVFPVPLVVANPFVSLVALGAAVVASVRLGRLGRWPDRLLTWVGAVGVLVALAGGSGSSTVVYDDGGTSGPYGVLVSPEGRVITNIWPFDADGNLVDGVFLYDQDGLPIDVGDVGFAGISNPSAIPGLFPQEQHTDGWDDRTGAPRRVPVTAPVVSVPRLPNASTSTTPSTTSTTTATTATTVPGDPTATTAPAAVTPPP